MKQAFEQEELDSNVVRICGRVMNRFDKPGITILTVSTLEIIRGEKQINYPKIYFFSNDNTGVENFMRGDEVVIHAHIAAPRKYRRTGQQYVSQAVVGDSIRKRQSLYGLMMNEENAAGPLEPQTNLMYIKGPLLEARTINDKVCEITVLAEDHGHKSAVHLTSFRNEVLLIRPGTIVTVHGRIRTRVRFQEGEKPKRYQNYEIMRIMQEEGGNENGAR